jgi:GcrA cell cycle regulator
VSYWSEARIDRLRELLAEGSHYSAGDIARLLSRESRYEPVTRCAVLGKIHRLKWSHLLVGARPEMPEPKPAPARKPPPRPGVKPPQPPVDNPLPAPQAARRSLMELEPASCRWPSGDPRAPDFRFCSAPAAPERPYCTHHCRLAYVPWRR